MEEWEKICQREEKEQGVEEIHCRQKPNASQILIIFFYVVVRKHTGTQTIESKNSFNVLLSAHLEFNRGMSVRKERKEAWGGGWGWVGGGRSFLKA